MVSRKDIRCFFLERRWRRLSQICVLCVLCWRIWRTWDGEIHLSFLSARFLSCVILIVPSFFSAVTLCTWFKCRHRWNLTQTSQLNTLQKSTLRWTANGSSDGNLLWCTSLCSAFSHRYLMSALGGGRWCFTNICKYRAVGSITSPQLYLKTCVIRRTQSHNPRPIRSDCSS